MILKLGRVVDGTIVETFWVQSERWAIAMCPRVQELDLLQKARDLPGVDRITAFAPYELAARNRSQLRIWRMAEWDSFLATLTPDENPFNDGTTPPITTSSGGIILPGPLKP